MKSAESSEPGDKSEESRFREMEVRLAYQDHLIAELDGVVRSFAMRVERLERQITDLKESVGAGLEIGSGNEAPPHY
ncbi:MAG: SlyX family protein [Myxococcales bacterium]|nr:SlyX family protein [Myxococcales bacterium]